MDPHARSRHLPVLRAGILRPHCAATAGPDARDRCGEGRVVRELASRGHTAVGLDGSPTLVHLARAADAASTYLAGDATKLPFADATFDLVVAYNSLQTMADMHDMARAVRETGRVLRPGGHLCVCVAHPMTDVVRTQAASASSVAAPLVIAGSYFESQRVDDTVMNAGLTMTFRGWTHTLEDYTRAIEDAGFIIERLREPVPTAEQAADRPSLERWRQIPLFLLVRAMKWSGVA